MSMRWLGLLLLSVLLIAPRAAEAFTITPSAQPLVVADPLTGGGTIANITLAASAGDPSGNKSLTITNCSDAAVGTFTVSPQTNFSLPEPITVTFTATTRGVNNCTLNIVANGTTTPVLGSFTMRGIGAAPELQITTPGPLDFGAVRLTTAATLTSSRTVTLTNAGTLPLSVTTLALSGTNAADYAISPMPTVPVSIAAGATQDITLVFDPSATGTRAATLTVTSDDPINPSATLSLTGTGGTAVIGVTDVAFGTVNLTQTGTGTITVSNTATGGAPLTLASATISGGSWFSFGGTGGCTGGATTCTPTTPTVFPKAIPVNCNPPAGAAGSQTGIVTFTSDSDPVADDVAMLSCTAGVAAAVVDTANLAFGSAVVATTTAVQTVTLENTGNVALSYGLSKTGTGASQFTLAASCLTGCSLAAGGQTTIDVAFAPTSMGAKTASLVITSANDFANPTISIALTGTGTAGVAAVTPASLAFGTVEVGATSTAQVITVTNTGTSDLTIADAGFSAGATDYAVPLGITGAQTTVIGPGMNTTWSVACAPIGQGSRPGTFRIVTNSGGTAGQNSDVSLTCTGLRGRLTIAATSHDFGAVSAGSTASQTFTLSNTGNVAVNTISATVSNTMLGYAVTSPALPITSLAAGASVTITVEFAPLSGADGGPATVTFAGTWGANATPSSTVLSLDGDGLSIGYDVSATALAFGDVRFDATATQVVCITNTSQSNVTITASTITPAAGTTTGEFAVTATHRRACGATSTNVVTLPQALTPGQTLEMVVRVDPANRVGAMAATLTLNSNLATNPTRTVDLTATSTSAMLTTTPGVTIDFGNVDLQAGAQTRDIVITNTGDAILDLGAFSRSTNARFTLTLPGATAIAPAAALTVTVTYTPTSEAAPNQADSFTLTHSVAGDIANVPGSQTLTVRGRGVDRHLALAPVPAFPATFRNPGAAAPVRNITVINTGEATLAISAVMVTNAEVWQVDTTPVDIAGGASHEFAVTFSPTVAGPAPQGELVFSNDDDQQPMATVLLDGLGVDRMVVMDQVIDFGLTAIGVPVSQPDALTVTSTDPTTGFVIRAIEIDEAAFTLDADTAGVALAPSASVAFGVTFTPEREGAFETRARLFLDEDPLAQAEVTIKGQAVFVEATGGGGCQASGGGSGATGGLALILAGVLATRRRRRAAVAGALATALLPALAHGQSAELDLSLFNPTPSTVGTTIQLQPAGVGTSGSLATMAVASYATNPLILNLGSTEHLTITQRSTLELGVAYAFLGRLEAGVRMPFYNQAGDGAMVGVGSPSGSALGDLTAHVRAQLLGSSSGAGLVLGLGGQVTVPTASSAQFAGVDGPSGKAQLLVSLHPAAARSRFTLTANAGAVIRPASQLSNIEQGSGATFGAGVSVRVFDALWVIGEAFGEVVPSGRRASVMASQSALVTAEYLGGLTYRPTRQIAVGLAAGRGLVAGVGTPDLRGVLSLTVTPSARALAPIYPPPPPPVDGDEDADGLKDSKDRCPDEAEDKDGFADDDGCPDPDNDQDGVIDAADRCGEPEDKDGFEDGDGCPDLDNDGDGVTDVADMCPLAPEDKDGFADDDGCAEKDNDKDGIDDDADKCPIQEEAINGVDDDDGCPDKGDSLVILTPSALELLEPIQFTGAKLSPKSSNLLGQIAATLRAHPDILRFKVVVHVNPSADAAKDLDVATKRAQAVRDWIVQWGIAASRVQAQGLGGKKPLVPATQKGAASINERAELIILERK